VHELIDVNAPGTFLGKGYNGAETTPAEFDNNVEAEYRPWVEEKIEKIRVKRCIIRWADVVDPTTHPKPRNRLPLGVEKSKPKLFLDRPWLIKINRHIPFSMDSVGHVAQTAWKGAHQTTLAHQAVSTMSR